MDRGATAADTVTAGPAKAATAMDVEVAIKQSRLLSML